ncbi:MAG: triphosphoribosyl-dephospho-CoA synthase [Candidatus Methylomirabilales bacterium]
MRDPRDVAHAAQLACLLEVSTVKPGNVHPHADFRDTCYEDFLLSALAIGDAMRQVHRTSVGMTVLRAIRDTRRVVSVNTNLGTVLLLAPLAKAAVARAKGGLRTRVRKVLQELTVQDARHVYSAIRLAKPGGLGRVPRWDVRRSRVDVSLVKAMQDAANRDTVAREYVTAFAVTFDVGLPTLKQYLAATPDLRTAIVQTYLTILATVPDSLIARKVGLRTAVQVSREADKLLRVGGAETVTGRRYLAGLDRRLRLRGNLLNPGTTADLTAASLFVALLEDGMRRLLGRDKLVHR